MWKNLKENFSEWNIMFNYWVALWIKKIILVGLIVIICVAFVSGCTSSSNSDSDEYSSQRVYYDEDGDGDHDSDEPYVEDTDGDGESDYYYDGKDYGSTDDL